MQSSRPPRIDINKANERELVKRLKISPRLAQRIMRLRPFHTEDDIRRLWGLDAETLERILSQVTLGPEETPGETAASSPAPDSGTFAASPDPVLPSGVIHPLAPAAEPKPKAANAWDRRPAEPGSLPTPKPPKPSRRISWGSLLLLGLILLVGAYFRFTGLEWDQNTHQHPDERFLTMVAERIRPVGIGDYFNTPISTLNPFQNNASYTYGMLPLFLTRMVASWLDMTHYDKVVLVGRALSGLFDLAVVVGLALLGRRLFDKRVGLLAAALFAAAVLPIQLSHFFTVDSFSTLWVVAGFYFAYQAVPLLDPLQKPGRRNLLAFALFGLAAGLAMASKINTFSLFGVIVLAAAAQVIAVWKQKEERAAAIRISFLGLMIAAASGFLIFRIFQPYAFNGPGFFGWSINPRWLAVMNEVTGQVAGLSEWPPNHHWTSRPFLYAWSNMVSWGLGLPLGIAAWAAWIFAIWRCFQGEWRRLLLPAAWVGGYFIWQNIQFWRYMRYFLPIYPILLLLAAWGLVRLWDATRASRGKIRTAYQSQVFFEWNWKPLLPGILAGLACLVVVAGAYLYAFGFTRIYQRPITRMAASAWILEHIRGPLNVTVVSNETNASADVTQTYPIASPPELSFAAGDAFHSAFVPLKSGKASQVTTERVSLVTADLRVKIYTDADHKDLLAEGFVIVPASDTRQDLILRLPEFSLEAEKTYYLVYKLKSGGPVAMSSASLRRENDQDPALPLDWSLTSQKAGIVEGTLELTSAGELRANRLVFAKFQGKADPAQVSIQVNLTQDDGGQEVLASASATQLIDASGGSKAPVFPFSPVTLERGKKYFVHYKVLSGGPVIFSPEPFTLETTWDDALPLGIEPYHLLGGVYAPANMELYEPDTPEKRARMLEILEKSDYLVLPSNRAYDAMPRLPLRYPLTLKYYQLLFDCPGCTGDALEEKAYQLQAPYQSPLGFDLAASFTSDPSIGPFRLNDRAADESFTVYDHPQVLIFRKSANFSIDQVRAQLESVDLSQVIQQVPLVVSKNATGYQLPADRLVAQQAGGTWFELFSPQAILNSSQPVGALAWYLALFLLGLLFFPAVFLVFQRLPDRGYPLARFIALLASAWAVWLLGSLKLAPFTRWTLLLVVICFGFLNMLLALKYWDEITAFISAHWRSLLAFEGLFAVLFGFCLALRMGNPDLWQPWMGGEKPMDFAIFNSVLKSVYFPPANPWFSGYYLNYYYFGYVIAAVPTRLLGIVPSIAYNLVLPSWFAMTGAGAFCAAYNLVGLLVPGAPEPVSSREPSARMPGIRWAWAAGLAAVVLMLFAGNLFQVRQLWKYLPEAAPAQLSEGQPRSDGLGAVLSGAAQVIRGASLLPGQKSRWYFDPSRPILNGVNNGADTPIAEFPYFTFLFGDMHPHLLVMPAMFAALVWMLACLLGAAKRQGWVELAVFWFTASLILGVFRAAHTWDYLTFLGLAVVATAWAALCENHLSSPRSLWILLGKAGLLAGLSALLYAPFGRWFITRYNSVQLWTGLRTPLLDYLSVHGLFLFILVSFLALESFPWVQAWAARWQMLPRPWPEWNRPTWVRLGTGLAVVLLFGLLWAGDYQVFVLALPLLAWAGVLFFRKGQPMLEQILLALFAAGLAITLLVEVVVLKGDNGRQNMVFYYYIQVWALFSLAAGVGLILLFKRWKDLPAGLRWGWTAGLALLALAAATYPLTATPLRLADRWPGIANPPPNLDGMAYMLGNAQASAEASDLAGGPGVEGAIYDDEGKKYNLGLDYNGIRYMQENVTGTPTIVEGNRGEYRWTARYAIYTGLPTVAGWSWHVRQHNSMMDGAIVERRIEDIKQFYNTPDPQAALDFLQRYQVSYIIVGDLERSFYSSEGLAKFDQLVQQEKLRSFYKESAGGSILQIYQVVSTQ